MISVGDLITPIRSVRLSDAIAWQQPMYPTGFVDRIIPRTRSTTSPPRSLNGVVSQRASVPSTSGSIPFVSAVWTRSSHRGLASGGMRLEVSHSTRLEKSSGALSARVWPIMPPIESPTQWVRGIPRARSSAWASSAS